METVYAFEYRSCIYESAMAVQSLHKTKEGAEEALERFLQHDFKRYKKSCAIMRQCPKPFAEYIAWKKEYEDWQVTTWTVNQK